MFYFLFACSICYASQKAFYMTVKLKNIFFFFSEMEKKAL